MTSIEHRGVTGGMSDRQWRARQHLQRNELPEAVALLLEQIAEDLHLRPGPTDPPPNWEP